MDFFFARGGRHLALGLVLRSLLALGPTLALGPARAHAAPKPVKEAVLFRVDASAGPGSYQLRVSNTGGEEYSSYALAIGPRLGLNLGYGVSRLVRIGVGTAAAFSMNLADEQGIPTASVDGWARWTVGPSVGFRFGPKVPIELDVAVNFANFTSLGSQGGPPSGELTVDALAKQYGMTSTVLLLWRPGGADDPFALHAGLEGTWGLSSTTTVDGYASENAMFLQSLLLGITLGL